MKEIDDALEELRSMKYNITAVTSENTYNMAVRSLEAWDEVIRDINEFDNWMSEEVVTLIERTLRKIGKDIEVGDEILNKHGTRGIVRFVGDNWVRVEWINHENNFPFLSDWERHDVMKTGRHFSQIAEAFEEMDDDSK